MRTIETTAVVTEDGKLTLTLPPDIAPGKHQVVIVLEEQVSVKNTRRPLDLPVRDYGPWPENFSLRRGDMYDDWGR
jgi:hypothetical protein